MSVDFNLLIAAAENALTKYLKATTQETCLVVFDDSTTRIAEAFSKAGETMGLSLSLRHITKTGEHGRDPDPETAAMMKSVDVVFAPTQFSLTHTNASKAARDSGSRVATLPGISEDLFARGLNIDPLSLKAAGEQWIRYLQDRSDIHITTEKGTDLSFKIGEYPLKNDDGCLFEQAILGNLPAGEVFCSPNQATGDGILVIDGSVGSFPWTPESPSFTLEIREGKIVAYDGERGRLLHQALSACGEGGLLLAEFGIGTNPELHLSGNLLEDEKVKGTIHLAFGNNCGFGGANNVPIHIDCLVTEPTVYADKTELMNNGKWLMQ